VPEPPAGILTVTEAVERGDRLEVVRACLYRLAVALEDDATPASALAPLAKVIDQLGRELAALLDKAEAEKGARLRVVDQVWDPSAI
jgi:hypothetical protein